MTADITMYGADWCRDCVRSKALLDKHGVNYEYVDLLEVPEAADVAQSISGRTNIPVIQFSDGSHLVEPSDAELLKKLQDTNNIL